MTPEENGDPPSSLWDDVKFSILGVAFWLVPVALIGGLLALLFG